MSQPSETPRYDGWIAFARALERELSAANRLIESLRRELADPPADVQELVIRKLDLVSADALAKANAEVERLKDQVDSERRQHAIYGQTLMEERDTLLENSKRLAAVLSGGEEVWHNDKNEYYVDGDDSDSAIVAHHKLMEQFK